MATTFISRNSLSSTSILSQLNGLSFTGFSPGAVLPLSLLSEDRKSDPEEKLYCVDRCLIPIFRRLNGRSQTVNVKQQPLSEADPDLEMESSSSSASEEPHRAKRARLEEPPSSQSAVVKTLASYEEQVIDGLELFLKSLKSYHTLHENDSVDSLELTPNTLQTPFEVKNFGTIVAKRFIEFGGLDRVITLLLARTNHHEPGFGGSRRCSIQSLCFDALRNICMLDKVTSIWLSENDEILNFCFEKLTSEDLCQKSAALIEVIFLHRPKTLNLCSLPNLQVIIQKLDGQLLANFCKILSLAISDLDMYDQKSSLYQQNLLKRSEDFMPVRDINQELILSIPGFLSKLVGLAVKQPYEPRYPNVPTEIDHWMRLIDDSISARITTGTEVANRSLALINERRDFDFIGNHLLERVDAMSVLSLLMAGKHRKEVQGELVELKLLPKLSELFDSFIWKHGRQRTSWHLPGHHTACECSPEVAVKIQFLRLVHSFCDNCDFKYSLLSPVEWEELERIKKTLESDDVIKDDIATPPLAEAQFIKEIITLRETGAEGSDVYYVEDDSRSKLDSARPELMCKGKKGLLSKIVDVLAKEPITSTFRFWLCRAVESYLKGRATIQADQIFLLRRGLVQSVTTSLINTDPRQKEIIQSSFDLLGELMKYNLEGCRQMDAILNSEFKLKKAMVLVNENLVDSNMFIRAMVLAADHFINKTGNVTFALSSRLLTFFRGMDKHIGLIERLTRILQVNSLTQENISCLNTALVILMVNRRNGKLSLLLSEIANRSNRPPKSQLLTLNNLRNLLLFWQEHYLHKDKDCTQLEKSSQIAFHYWKSTVELLVQNTTCSFFSILRYVEAPPSPASLEVSASPAEMFQD